MERSYVRGSGVNKTRKGSADPDENPQEEWLKPKIAWGPEVDDLPFEGGAVCVMEE